MKHLFENWRQFLHEGQWYNDFEETVKKYPNFEEVAEFYQKNSNFQNNKYIGKFVSWVKKYNDEDPDELIQLFNHFKNNKRSMKDRGLKKLDLMQYSHPNELEEVIEEFGTKSKREKELEIKQDSIKAYEDENVIAIIPLSEKASCKYGKETRWCTAADKSRNAFEQYFFEQGVTLAYVIHKNPPKEKYKKIAWTFYDHDGKDEPVQANDARDKRIERHNLKDIYEPSTYKGVVEGINDVQDKIIEAKNKKKIERIEAGQYDFGTLCRMAAEEGSGKVLKKIFQKNKNDPIVLRSIARNENTPSSLLKKIASFYISMHPDELKKDNVKQAIYSLLKNPNTPRSVFEKFTNIGVPFTLQRGVAETKYAPQDILKKIFKNNPKHIDFFVSLSRNSNTPQKILESIYKRITKSSDVSELGLNTQTKFTSPKNEIKSILSNLAKNPNTSAETLIKIIKEQHSKYHKLVATDLVANDYGEGNNIPPKVISTLLEEGRPPSWNKISWEYYDKYDSLKKELIENVMDKVLRGGRKSIYTGTKFALLKKMLRKIDDLPKGFFYKIYQRNRSRSNDTLLYFVAIHENTPEEILEKLSGPGFSAEISSKATENLKGKLNESKNRHSWKYLINEWRAFLKESPQALGFSEETTEVFREAVPDNRKARHRLAQLVKHYEVPAHVPSSQDTWCKQQWTAPVLKKLANNHTAAFRKLAKKLGIRGYNDLYTGDILMQMERCFGKYGGVTIDELRTATHKLIKTIKEEGVNFEFNYAFSISFLYPVNAVKHLLENDFKPVVDFLNRDPDNHAKLKNKSPKEAIEFTKNNNYDKDKVIHEFDNGYFWYGPLSSEECEKEGEAMSHCGGAENKTYSLRSPSNSSKVTLEFEKGKNVVTQIKGKGNTVPKKKYWAYIEAWMDYWNPRLDLKGEFEGGPDKYEFVEYIAGKEEINLEEFIRNFMIEKQKEFKGKRENLDISEFSIRQKSNDSIFVSGIIHLKHDISNIDDDLKQKIQKKLNDQRLLEKIFQFEEAYGLDSRNAGAKNYGEDFLTLIFPFAANFRRRQTFKEQIGGWLEEVKYESSDMLEMFIDDYYDKHEKLNESKIHIKIQPN